MSTVFSRRSFLKYTAVTAVAVAGTSLLGGCSGSGAETAIQTTYPSDNVVLKVKSTLETLEYDPTDGYATFTIHIVNGRKNPIVVSPNRFAVKAYDKNNNCIANIFVGSTQGSLNAVLAPGDTNPIRYCIRPACDEGRGYRMPRRFPAYHLHPGYRVQRVHRKLDHLPGYCGPCFGLTLTPYFVDKRRNVSCLTLFPGVIF
mgnify:CR=1 FL=1